MKSTQVLRDFREQLNLSQSEMAKFLRTTRTQLSLVEMGVRPMKIKSVLELANLYNCSKPGKAISIDASMQIEEERALAVTQIDLKWREKLAKITHDIGRLNYKLRMMQAGCEINMQLIMAMEHLLEVTDNNYALDYYRTHANNLRRNAHESLRKCGEPLQTELELQIQLLQAQAKIIQSNLHSGK